MKTTTFHETLELVDSLSENEKESLIEIIRHRLIEEKRNQLSRNIKKARQEYRQRKIRRGNIDDLLRDIQG